jgi:glycosyltransferase involved in cell wall biosynthesis
MKISFIYDCAYPSSKGGAEKRIYDFAKHLAKYVEVEIISMRWWTSIDSFKSENIKYYSICPKIQLYNGKGRRKILPGILFGIKTFFYILKTDSDIIDLEVFPYFPLIFARFAVSLKKKKPKIIGYWSECLGKQAWRRYSKYLWIWGFFLEKLCAKSSDINIANSEFTKNRLKSFLIKNNNDVIVLNPILIDISGIQRAKRNQNLIYDIIYFGRLISHKNVDKIIKLVDKLVNNDHGIKALIIGNGPSESFLKQIVKQFNLSNYISFIDFVEDHNNLLSLIKTAKIYILPSEREGFGISVIEANACGLPVLILDFPDNASKELIFNGKNGFICKDEKDLYEKVIFVLNKYNYAKMSKRSMETAMRFNFVNVINRIVSTYKNIYKLNYDLKKRKAFIKP